VKPSPPPAGLSRRSARLWREILDANDLSADILETLERSLNAFDLADERQIRAIALGQALRPLDSQDKSLSTIRGRSPTGAWLRLPSRFGSVQL
jgi:hypothetical protein